MTLARMSASVLACLSITWMVAAAAERTVWDGIYTEQQAARGRTAYLQACASCHADDLRGKSTAPSLVEESFAFQWGDMSVDEQHITAPDHGDRGSIRIISVVDIPEL